MRRHRRCHLFTAPLVCQIAAPLHRHFGVSRSVGLLVPGTFQVPGTNLERLQQAQLARLGDRFRAALDLEFVEDVAVVSFDRIQRQE